MIRNPFVTNGYAGAEYFCDRVEETKFLVRMLTNENNIALISPRRLGKTDLIRHCLVAIDEFQQITHYAGGDNIEAALRTYIQRCPNANFVFSGSQRHLMGEMFTSPARPFYQSVTVFNLKPIPLDKYREFAIGKFEQAGKHLADGVVDSLYERFDSITSYMQKL